MSKSNAKHAPKTWYRLDLSAIVYPTLQRRDFSSVYRLSVLLKDPVQPDILQQAVDIAMKRFPTYHSAMRKGFFWRYLEPNTRPGPFVKPDIRNFCMPMPFKSNNRYLVRFYWYDRRISLEAHHSLGDGTGGMYLLQTVTAVYLRLLGHEISNGGFVLDVNETPDPEEFEELLSIYNRYSLKNLIIHPRVQTDYYKNHPHMEAFALAEQESKNPVIYNGDLFCGDDIKRFADAYPKVSAVMLGRGLLTNPALAEDAARLSETDKGTLLTAARIRAFHEDVLEGYRKAIPGDKNVLFKMKELWTYLGEAFEDSAKPMKKIRKAQRMEEYRAAVEALLLEKPVCSVPRFPGWNR